MEKDTRIIYTIIFLFAFLGTRDLIIYNDIFGFVINTIFLISIIVYLKNL